MATKTETKIYSDIDGEYLPVPVQVALHWERKMDAGGSMENWAMRADLSPAQAARLLYILSMACSHEALERALTEAFRDKWKDWGVS